jgi:hypothetical protein
MAYTGIGMAEVREFLKSCSSVRLDKVTNYIWSLQMDRDDKRLWKATKGAAKKGTKAKSHSNLA